MAHLLPDFLADSCKSDRCVDILTIHDVWDVREDPRLPVNEPIQYVLLKSLVIVLYTLTFTKGQGVVAV